MAEGAGAGDWQRWAGAEVDAIAGSGRNREPVTYDTVDHGPTHLSLAGRRVVSFASNDYLGLSRHTAVVAAARAALERWGAGAGAARLVSGSRPVHDELEAEIANWKATEAVALFPTGFAANLGLLSALGGPGVTIFSDEANHASIVDGCRLARADVAVYRHCDMDHLETLMTAAGLPGAPGQGRTPAIVVSDSVFSMDGDLAPVDALAACCARRGALLVLDEAHAVLGPELSPGGAEVVLVGTLSKALGSLGGFVAGSRPLVELVVNRARSYIFTTGSPPADSAAALAALRVLRSGEGAELLSRLRSRVDQLVPGHRSPIVPIIIGSERDALAASAWLLELGMLVPAIRPPTVPSGTSRLRVTVSAAHTEEEIAMLTAALAEVARAA